MKLLNKNFKATKKGSTLSELCVVIALVAIVSVAVVSFTTMAGAITKVSAAKEMAAENIEHIERLVEGWVENAISKNATQLEVLDNRLVAKIDDQELTLSFSGDTLTAKFSQDNTATIVAEEITKIDFEEMRNSKDLIFFCTVTYELENSQEEKIDKTHTFCINSRLDDIV